MEFKELISVCGSIAAVITLLSAGIAYLIEKRKMYLKQYGKLKRETDANLVAIKYFPYKNITPLTLDESGFPKFVKGLSSEACEFCLDTNFKIFMVSNKVLTKKLTFLVERITLLKYISEYQKNETTEVILKRRINTLEKYLLELQIILDNANRVKRQKRLTPQIED